MVNPVSGTSSTTDLKPATHPLLPRLALFRCGPGSLELRSHCPPTSTPRCRQHTEDCAADHPTRRCRRVHGNGRLIGRRVLEVDAWSNEGFNWLGEVIRYESARLASWELIKVMRQVHHHPRRWFQGSGRGTLSETASISLEKRPVRRVKIKLPFYGCRLSAGRGRRLGGIRDGTVARCPPSPARSLAVPCWSTAYAPTRTPSRHE